MAKREDYKKLNTEDLKKKLELLKLPLLQSSTEMGIQKIPVEKHKMLRREVARIKTELNRRKN